MDFKIPRFLISIICFACFILIYTYATLGMSVTKPYVQLYHYILSPMSDNLLWFIIFIGLIFGIQFMMLYEYSIKEMRRAFKFSDLSLCLLMGILCNVLIFIDIISKAVMVDFNLDHYINPILSTGIMCLIFGSTYGVVWLGYSVLKIVT